MFHRLSEIITSYGGVAREIRGDALVAEFDRASDAVTAAITLQTQNEKLSATLAGQGVPCERGGKRCATSIAR